MSEADASVNKSEEKTLIIPAVAVGNVGQLAIELLTKQFVDQKHVEYLDHTGCLSSCVGRIGKPANRLTTSFEFLPINSNTACLQIRSTVVPGRSREFAKLILEMAASRGFKRILVVGGASALALINDEQLTRTRDIPRAYNCEFEGCLPLEHDVKELKLTGLLRYLVEQSQSTQSSVVVSALILFVFEGENDSDGERMAATITRTMDLRMAPASS